MTRRTIFFGIILLLNLSPALAVDAPALPGIGDVVPPFPDGIENYGGACAYHPGSADICAMSVGDLSIENGEAIAVFAGKRSGYDAEGRAFWEITDIVELPPIEEGYFFDHSLCVSEDSDRHHPVAIVRNEEDVAYLTDIAWAMALDLETGLFVDIDPDGLTCENPVP